MSHKSQPDGFALEAQRDVNIYEKAMNGHGSAQAEAKVAFAGVVNGWLQARNDGLRNLQKVLSDMQGINPAAAAAYTNAFEADRNHYSPNPDVIWKEGTGR